MIEAAIVIVTHNSAEEIGPCLDAALPTGAEVIVVDNGSLDGTLEGIRGRGAALIANPENRGFAAAVNQGVRGTRANLVLLLNPDAVLQTGIEKLCAAFTAPKVGAAAGKLVDSNHSVQAGFNVRRLPTATALAFEALLINRLWPRNPVNWHYRCYDFSHNEPATIEQPAGAFLMFRRGVWEELGGLDERFYPVWFEDVDFCKRLRDHGYYVYYEPSAVATHQGGHSIRKILLEKREIYWYGGLLKYGSKHFNSVSSRLLCLAVIIGSLLRMIAGIVCQGNSKPIKVFSPVIRLAGRYLLFGPGRAVVVPFSQGSR